MDYKEQAEHYKIYLKAWQRARGMLVDEMNSKTKTKEEKLIMMEIYHIMTQAINHEVKSIKLEDNLK